MSLFHRDDKEGEANRIDEDMAAAAERAPRLGDDPIREEPALASRDVPLEESIDEPSPHAAAYFPQHSWADRSRQRLDEQINDTCQSCDDFVQRKPWQSVGIAALGGALLTLILSRR